jgi:predicted DNA binding CopG/RHH family protein
MPLHQRSSYAPAGRIGKCKNREQEKCEDMDNVRVKRKKAGRPVKNIKKEIKVCVRYSRHDHFIVREKAANAGLRLSAYLRKVSIEVKIIPRLTEEERQFVKQLIGMANNLNQLTKACHQEGLLSAMLDFEKYRTGIDELLKKLRV